MANTRKVKTCSDLDESAKYDLAELLSCTIVHKWKGFELPLRNRYIIAIYEKNIYIFEMLKYQKCVKYKDAK